MSREDPQLKVRLPLELKNKITESAESLGRSVNADVVARLERSFKDDISSYEEALREAKLEFLLKELTVRMGVFRITVSGTEDEYLSRKREIEVMKKKKEIPDDDD